MEAIVKSKRKAFILSVILSVFLIAGVPMIIVGAINGGLYRIMMGFGIVMTVLGFYGTPLSWVGYAGKSKRLAIVRSIEVDKVYDIAALCRMYNMNHKLMVGEISKAIEKGALKGLLFNKDYTALIYNDDFYSSVESYKKAAKCVFCGALVEFNGRGGKCPYCGNILTAENITEKY